MNCTLNCNRTGRRRFIASNNAKMIARTIMQLQIEWRSEKMI